MNTNSEVDILGIMAGLNLPICIEPQWDEKQHRVMCEVTLDEAYIGLCPADSSAQGVALALAAEFERLARGIREAVQERLRPVGRRERKAAHG